MSYITKFGGYQADSDLSDSDWTKRWNTAATATVLGIGFEFITSGVNPSHSPFHNAAGIIPSAGTYIIGLTGNSDDAPGVQGVSIDGQLGQELFELVDGDNFISFWLVDPSSFSAGDLNILLNSTHRGVTFSVTQVFGNVTTYGDSAQGLTGGASDSLTTAIRNVLIGLAYSGTPVFVGNTSSTKVLLHMDGADASTTFIDSNVGGAAKTWTAAGNAQIDTAQSKFGGSSGLFDGTGDWVSTPDSSEFTLGNANFTIDLWFNCNKAGGTDADICGQTDGTAANTSFFIDRASTNVMRLFVSDGVSFTAIAGTTQFTNLLNTGWHHLAVVRDQNVLRLFIDGVQENSIAYTAVIPNQAGNPTVGRRGDSVNAPWIGWIDEFRMSIGVARWTANFTPPTSAYSADSGAGNASNIQFWHNLVEQLDQAISGSAYWSHANQLLLTDATSREIAVSASENPTTLTWAALAFHTPVTYFPSGQGARFEVITGSNRTLWSWDTVPQISDVEILALVRPTTQALTFVSGVAARCSGPSGAESGYTFDLRQTSPGTQDLISLEKRVDGTFTQIGVTAFAWSLDTNYWLRFRLRDTTLQGRIWAESQTEPTTWNIETTDASLTSGFVGIFGTNIGVVLEVGYFEARELFIAWPTDTIPNNWTIGIQGGPQSNKIAFNPDVGPSIDRRRASAVNRKYQVDCPGLTQEEYLAFVEFYHTTLKEGTLPFMAMDPFTGLEKVFKFGTEDPAYNESVQRAPGPDYTNGIYQVSFTVTRLD